MKTHGLWLRAVARNQSSNTSRGLRRDERGASAVEYGLLIAGIAAMIAITVFAFGGGANGLFHGSCSTIMEDTSTGSCP